MSPLTMCIIPGVDDARQVRGPRKAYTSDQLHVSTCRRGSPGVEVMEETRADGDDGRKDENRDKFSLHSNSLP
jgi:hypothetical protein